MKINDAYDYLIHLITCAIHNRTPEPLPNGIDAEQVLSCSIRHEVAGFAYLGAIRAETNFDANILNKWKQRYLLGVSRHTEQEEARKTLVSALHKKGIATLEIQGTRVKKYYPSPELRMMSDIDIIIEKEYIPEAEKILINLGYKTVRQGDFEVDANKNDINIEIHTDFFHEDNIFTKIINEPFKAATVQEDLNASVSDTVFWIYHLLHCLKHYTGKGIGMRRVLDLYFLAPEMAKTADNEYVDKLLKDNGLYEDVQDLIAVAKYWFDGIVPDRNIQDIISVMKTAGTHGNMDIYLNNKFADIHKQGKRFVKLRYCLSRVFPSKIRIYMSCPRYKKYRLPYPIAWFCYTIRIMLKPRTYKQIFRYLRNIRKVKLTKYESD